MVFKATSELIGDNRKKLSAASPPNWLELRQPLISD
jgi:hypothetical protein